MRIAPPSFTEGNEATRSVAENTGSGQDIGSAVSATDLNADTLTYTLGGADAASFSINGTNGQLQTKAALDYEAKTSYSVSITVSDTKLTDTIDVTINVTDVNEAPNFASSTATRSIAENTASGEDIGAAVVATDPDTDDTLTYSLGGTDVDSFSIVNTSGQLRTNVALDHETKDSYSVTVTATDGDNLSDTTTVTISVTNVNEAPSFTEGSNATRAVAENTASDTNIGSAIAATDPDDDTLTYTLSGADAASFSINGTNGQLQTKAALDYEAKSSYSVSITVSDTELTDTIDVTINVTDVNENRAPVFTDGSTTTRAVAENTGSGQDIGSAVAATDLNADTLTYTLGGADAASFSIDGTSGQLQTKAALDYETQTSYTVTITVSDTKLTDTIDVTITVTNVNEAPNFATDTATRSIAENTASGEDIGAAVVATDPDADDTLTYTLGGTDVDSFSIVNTNGQLRTHVALDHETKASYSVTVTATDGDNLSDTTTVTISVTDVNEAPNFASSTATRSIAENTASGEDIGAAVVATDPDSDDTLTYSLGGTDVDSFSIVNTSGQLRTNVALDHETKATYSVTVTATDGDNLSDTTTVTISVTDVNEAPNFATDTTTRSVAENTGSGENIGAAVTATDPDSDDTLTYTLGGADAASFSIIDTSGQLQTLAALDYETKNAYSVTVSAADGNGGTDSITVTINVTDVNELPSGITPVADRTPQVRDAIVAAVPGVNSANNVTAAHLAAITTLKIGSKGITSLKSGDFSGLTGLGQLDLHVNSITDVSPLANLTSLTILSLYQNSITDVSPLANLTNLTALAIGTNAISDISSLGTLTNLTLLTVQNNSITDMSVVKKLTSLSILSLSRNPISDMSAVEKLTSLTSITMDNTSIEDISAVENLTNLTALEVGYNTISDISAVENLTKLTLLGLSGNSISNISAIENLTSLEYLYLSGNPIADYRPLRRLKAAIDQNEDHPGLYLDITIPTNNLPVFTEGASTTRSVAENTVSDTNIGAPVAATDADTHNILTYTLSGTDASSFSIVPTSGQLQTSAALDYETKASYSVTVDVSDSDGGSDSIPVTITVTNVNETPSFATDTATRSIAENTASGEDIGAAVVATDPDADDTLTYTLGGTDVDSFSIVNTSGHLRTSAALDHETKASYSVTVTATDGDNLSDTTTVTISVTNVNEAPSFTEGSTATRAIAENTASDTNIGSAFTATDVDANTTLTYTLSGTDAESFSIDGTNGQLQTKAALDYEAKSSYSVTITVSDTELTDTIDVTINVTDVNENRAPVFTDGSTTTRAVAENTGTGQDIGSAIAATDADTDDTLTYTLGGADAASFSINGTTGQLQTKAALDYETQTAYTVTITVSDSKLTDSIDVTISVTNVNEAPNFASSTATRSIAENTGSGEDIVLPWWRQTQIPTIPSRIVWVARMWIHLASSTRPGNCEPMSP